MLARPMTADLLEVVGLRRLMDETEGTASITIGLIDGPVAEHQGLATENVRSLSRAAHTAGATGAAAAHATFVAGILAGRRDSDAPAICPGCTLLVRPIFLDAGSPGADTPTATCDETAEAIAECVDAGARIINLSIGVAQPSPNRERRLEDALNYAAHRGTVVAAAAGNQRTIGSSPMTRHDWVIPVAACDRRGRPFGSSNFSASIGRRGLRAPGESVTSLAGGGGTLTSGGTSAATPFVTGTAALLWSAFPAATGAEIKRAMSHGGTGARTSIVPPLLDAWAAYQFIAAGRVPRRSA
jgi:subtilisin family serine protease